MKLNEYLNRMEEGKDVYEIEFRGINFSSEEDRKKVYTTLRELIDYQTESLVIRNLDAVVFTSSLGEEVLRFQQEKNITTTGITDSPRGIAAAKVVSYFEKEEERSVVFISGVFLQLLFDPEETWLARNIIHHELAHVHDSTMRFNAYRTFEISRTDDYMTIASKIGEILWMEYIADRLAIKSFGTGCELPYKHFLELTDSLLENMKEYRKVYFATGDSYRVFVNLQEESNLLLRITGNLLGKMHGLGLKDLVKQIPNSYFYPILVRLSDELERLHSIYPDWRGPRELLGLAEIIVDLWELYGVSFDADSDGILINIAEP